MDHSAAVVSWRTDVSGIGRTQAKALTAAVDDARVWLAHWPYLMSAVTPASVTFSIEAGAEAAVTARHAGDAVEVHIRLETELLDSPPGTLRRYLLDAVLEGAEEAAIIRPNDPPVEVASQEPIGARPDSITDSDRIGLEIALLPRDEMLVLQHLGSAVETELYDRKDDAFIDHIGELDSGHLVERSASSTAIVWTMSTEPLTRLP